MTVHRAKFDVHPSVVFKLGLDLITDEVQALAELIKNGYDADASRVIVRINTSHASPEFPSNSDSVEVIDNGVGMTIETLVSGWLTISNSAKRDMKEAGLTTKRGRTPMGDKGLGRLGAQRLGDRVTITTTPAGSHETNRLSFSWDDFHTAERLSNVPVTITSVPGNSQSGTSILISGLRDPEALSDLANLRRELAKIISPYEEVEDFRLYVSVDGEQLDLTAISTMVRDAAAVRYTFAYDGSILKMRCMMRLAQLRPNSKIDRLAWTRLVDDDQGEGLLAYLMSRPEAGIYNIRAARSKKWWLSFSHEIEFADVKPRMVDAETANPGPFSGQIDSFNLSAGSVQEVNVFDKASELRDLIRDMHGIRIYRTGFNVRVAEDWLGLGKQVTSGGSWYGLRPATTMGYVAISSLHNAQLTETTDREGFNDTPAYQNFRKLLLEFVDQSAKAQEFIGRGAVAYRAQHYQHVEDPQLDTEEVLLNLETALDRATGYMSPLRDLRSRLEVQAAEADRSIDQYARLDTSPHETEMIQQLNQLSRQAVKASEMLTSLEVFISDMSRQQGVAKRVQNDLDRLGEQLTLTYETMAVGLTAESISHEIGNIAERLARRATEVMRYVKTKYRSDARLITFVNQVQSTIAGLRRQLAHLSPSLRYVRERRELIAMSTAVLEVKEYFQSRWDGKIDFHEAVVDDFCVLMNRGKLFQIVDNIILNSEYWLLEETRLGTRSTAPAVTVTIDAPMLRIQDNGRGIDPQVESALFEPFVSKKPRGAGRGLGLFVVRQLLDAEGCEIELNAIRNARARRFAFDLDMSSVMTDG